MTRRRAATNGGRKVISTHILSQRMTNKACRRWVNNNISTHILSQRMTLSPSFLPSEEDFDSHPLTEDDKFRNFYKCRLLYFDSHPLTEDDRNIMCQLCTLTHNILFLQTKPFVLICKTCNNTIFYSEIGANPPVFVCILWVRTRISLYQ